jgi:pimeloyl-ACP methyl ester carboxylesterase
MDIRRGVAEANGLSLAYEDMGNVLHPAVLLIMGLSAQLTMWPDGFCQQLVDKGYRVIRFDNRDIGLSSKLSELKVTGAFWQRMLRAQFGLTSPVPYTLHDMAADVNGLMDFLQIPAAHVVGASMGGMIAQIFAAKYPDRVRSLGIIFSSTNQAFLPPPKRLALKPLTSGPGKNADEAAIIKHSMHFMRVINGPGYPLSDDELRQLAESFYRRSYYPAGVVRQFNAILGTGSLRPLSKTIRKPTVVIHGSADPLVRPACGKAVARAIPNSRYVEIKGMGHDLPPKAWQPIVHSLVVNMKR